MMTTVCLAQTIPAPCSNNPETACFRARLGTAVSEPGHPLGPLGSGLAIAALLALSLASPLPAEDSLTLIVSAARAPKAPAAAQTRLAEFARSHARSTDGALAQLALGLVEYEHNDFAGAGRDLNGLAARLPKIADYIAYYQASSQAM